MSGSDNRLARLQDALTALSEERRQVYLLHARDGVPLDEIAARLGLAQADVVAHLADALAALSTLLDDPPP